jgi:uncharacterized protein
MPCYRRDAAGIVLSVRLTPRGGRDAVDKIVTLGDGRELVAARVRAAPEKGAANDALVALIAAKFGTAKSAVTLISGAAGRVKQVRVEGDPATLAAIVEALPH